MSFWLKNVLLFIYKQIIKGYHDICHNRLKTIQLLHKDKTDSVSASYHTFSNVGNTKKNTFKFILNFQKNTVRVTNYAILTYIPAVFHMMNQWMLLCY